ncbi:serine-type D-Ala-D-Ala carboxypeptidase [Paenibacillus sp. CCS19]|uniref:D-alanyl-D-alanine carboxypeptidase family protein n=1 Tax=Paenibacillus sp. CCS19 TaxID=3158387 RepID=UPI00255E2432|nr:D-alanyl-D-alanine carboxypeptidase family protein [Paenibacillus cellulosilyticus]GMK38483.1 serine-type D-Ala-D-Ala carboxypeptidase [Paenibacillus cellulosilyticus]
MAISTQARIPNKAGWLRLAFAAALVLLIGMQTSASAVVMAAPATSETVGDQTSATEAEVVQKPEVAAESAVLIDGRTGTVLYSKNATEQMYPASITKIVTAIVALETADVSDTVTVSKDARWEEGTRVYLEEGEQMSMWQLLLGMMVNSGNDASTAIADHIDGSKEKFAERMNAFVREHAGAMNSQFRNPHGLPDPDHYTTAEDMAKIARYAMQNEQFRELVGTKKVNWTGETWQTTLVNHNKLLGTYEGATGIKNGYTTAAGQTLVASAKRGDMEIIGVVLKSPSSDQLYKDMRGLLDYGFAAFEQKRLFDENEVYHMEGMPNVDYVAEKPIWTVVPKGEEPELLVDTTGSVRVLTSQGMTEAGHFLVSHHDNEVKMLAAATAAAAETPAAVEEDGSNPGRAWTLAGACLLGVLAGATMVYRMRKRNGTSVG